MYTFERTEKNRGIAEEYETRAMLYLLNDKSELDVFLIDTFNDISGSNLTFEYIVDVQSKGIKTFPPSKIGISLITLFQNHLSDIKFNKYVLYCKYIDSRYIAKKLSKKSVNLYKINDFTEENKTSIIESLKKEYNKIYKSNKYDTIPKNIIKDFYKKLVFVEDLSLQSDLIRFSIDLKTIKSIDDEKLNKIFKDISTMREKLKRINIEGLKIQKAKECLQYNKYLKRKQIESLILSRVIGYDIFKDISNVPVSFVDVIKDLDIEAKKDIIIRVNSDISKAYFDVNNPKPFFNCIDFIIDELKNTTDMEKIYRKYILNVKVKPQFLTEKSTKFLISMIIDNVGG
ncbi:hypothetical protein KEC48_06570 [Clostridium sp. C1]|uniref:hypothetical protein n=1 Tax=Clostridium sp. C1 TaxID=1155388 RepID=UPI001BA88588|nr:hypothetical protein [Clostridium sp. C1]QUN14165.1 hypothetical protein KEC48_06570 [Clostridium sp. C1]